MAHPLICLINCGIFAMRRVSARVSGLKKFAKGRSVSASKNPVSGRDETGSIPPTKSFWKSRSRTVIGAA